MTRIEPGDSYVTAILPAVIVFGLGLTLVVAPVTATVLAAADSRHSGIASGINNAVSRVGGLLAVAVLPLIAGLTGDAFYDPSKMSRRVRHRDDRLRRARRGRRRPRLADDQLGRPRGRGRGRAATRLRAPRGEDPMRGLGRAAEARAGRPTASRSPSRSATSGAG